MQSRIQGQVRVARLWEVDQPSPSEWEAYANLYVEHHPGCLGLEWLSAQGGERWFVGARGAEERPQQRREGDGVRKQLLKDAFQSKDARVSDIFTSPEGKRQWLTAVPIYTQGHLRGTVIGLFDVQQSLDTMLDDIKGLNFSVALQQNAAEIYRLSGSTDQYRNDWEQTFDLSFAGASWKLQVWARPETMLEMRSNLPILVLFFGSFLSLLLTSIVQAHHELTSENTERRRAEEALRASRARFAGILEISAAAVISTTGEQRITLFNHAAERMFGYKAIEAIGQPLDILIPKAFREMHRQHFTHFARSDQSSLLMSERRPVLGLRKDGIEFPMAASISKLELGADTTFTVLCNDITAQVRAAEELRRARDELEIRVLQRTAELEKSNQSLQSEITERKLAEETVRVLSSKLMRVQDEERRHLARELHDGATQNMVSLALNLNTLRLSTPPGNAESRAILEECMRLIEGSTNELRTISYLLHPPLLEELGLVRALRGYIDGFSRRSGIHAVFSVPEDLGRLTSELELTLFRIVQEALSNVHRHSQSPTASIVLSRDGENLRLEIADEGIGINHGQDAAGVGLAGMRERVKLLRGDLEIKTGPAGTTIRTVLPVMEVKQTTSGTAV
ncbi:MAG: PAS domain-containing sensor histidine kinase [Candidatus Angelobacter sp.]